jgi:hypothetical protein
LADFLTTVAEWRRVTSAGGELEVAEIIVGHLRQQEFVVKEILKRLKPGLEQFDLDSHEGGWWAGVSDAERYVQRGLGILDALDELAAHLGPAGPTVAAESLHPWVWEAAQPLWASRHFRESVGAAATLVSANLQTKLGRYDINDDALVAEAFSARPPQAGKPRLRVPGNDQTSQSRQEGAVSYGRGCYMVIRNPARHAVGEWSGPLALERLAALSVLARLIDESEVIRAGGEQGTHD